MCDNQIARQSSLPIKVDIIRMSGVKGWSTAAGMDARKYVVHVRSEARMKHY